MVCLTLLGDPFPLHQAPVHGVESVRMTLMPGANRQRKISPALHATRQLVQARAIAPCLDAISLPGFEANRMKLCDVWTNTAGTWD